ncbi:MAG: 2-polyprenyl-6-methoxyphenol hydroxylase-like oxidoreductase [Chloroflexota bacterium]|nr:2-polyprenyl-6-methoxyphenol hydroxylase-like oxidoreductase [Chloroflexota bacterium]
MTTQREHAIVIGGSMAGVLAARALTDHFARVTLIERDTLPDESAHRGGVPQARHTHGLLARGLRILEAYFPGFERELAESGAVRVHWMRDTIQLIPTGWTPRFDSGIVTYACSRAHLDGLIRRRVRALPNLTIMGGWNVGGLVLEGERVVGVQIAPRPHTLGDAGELRADLIVDASGRGSHAPDWLQAHGYAAPTETRVDAKLGYSTRVYTLPPDFQPDWNAILMMTTPTLPRGGVFQAIEGGQWMLTMAGTNGDLPPTDEAGLLAFARSIPAPPLHDALDRATPISPIYGYQRTGNLMRHYERLARFPAGVVVLGDAVCAFNPVYGQGMTAAALGAQTLGRWLARDGVDGRAFQVALAKSNAPAWQMAINEDWRYANTAGDYPGAIVKRLNGYVDWLFDAAPDVPEVTQTFLQVMHLVTPSAALFKPSLVWKRLRWRKGGTAGKRLRTETVREA